VSAEFSGAVNVFHDRRCLSAPSRQAMPRSSALTSWPHRSPARFRPSEPALNGMVGASTRLAMLQASLEGHLTFALKYEGLDLSVLKPATGAADLDDGEPLWPRLGLAVSVALGLLLRHSNEQETTAIGVSRRRPMRKPD
jgi:hypothetical protein